MKSSHCLIQYTLLNHLMGGDISIEVHALNVNKIGSVPPTVHSYIRTYVYIGINNSEQLVKLGCWRVVKGRVW